MAAATCTAGGPEDLRRCRETANMPRTEKRQRMRRAVVFSPSTRRANERRRVPQAVSVRAHRLVRDEALYGPRRGRGHGTPAAAPAAARTVPRTGPGPESSLRAAKPSLGRGSSGPAARLPGWAAAPLPALLPTLKASRPAARNQREGALGRGRGRASERARAARLPGWAGRGARGRGPPPRAPRRRAKSAPAAPERPRAPPDARACPGRPR